MESVTPIKRVQYAQKVSDDFDKRVVFHFETDSLQVKIGDTDKTLDEVLRIMDGERTITLIGGVTGSVKMENGHSNAIIETTVTDDGHIHTGGTVKLETGGRVVVTDEKNKTIVVSDVTVKELGYLSGAKSNIQQQLDDKIKSSKVNGNVLVDDKELSVYIHPDIDDFEVSEAEDIAISAGSKINSVKNLSVDQHGHVTGIEMQPYVMPAISKFWVGTEEPTGQVVGDFWLETLNVDVEPGSFFLRPAGPGANMANTMVVNKGTEFMFNMLDPKTDNVEIDGATGGKFIVS